MFGNNFIVAPDIDWEQIGKDIDEALAKDAAVQMDPQLPVYFSAPDRMAQIVWEFFTNILHSDGIVKDIPIWNELDDDEKQHLIESFQTNVTEPLRKFMDALAKANSDKVESLENQLRQAMDDQARRQPPVVVQYPCYGCGEELVERNPGLCRKCGK